MAPRDQKYQSNFVEFKRSTKVVYRRYAGLFFCACVDATDNELAYLEAIHFFVEVLDQFFGNVCELDLVFNFYKVCVERRMVQSRAAIPPGMNRSGVPKLTDDRCTPFSTRYSSPARSKRRVNRSS